MDGAEMVQDAEIYFSWLVCFDGGNMNIIVPGW